MKTIVYLLIGLLAYWIIPSQVEAAGEFQVDYDIAYAISTNGVTTVTQNVTLTNKVSQLFAKQYVITVDSDKLKNIIAYDNQGSLNPAITQKDGKTEIRLTFAEPVAGIGKQHRFSLRYDNRDFVQKVGNIWEVNIPGVANDPNLGNYNISVDVPANFGKPAYLTPPPATANRWTKDQLLRGGIKAAFGEIQTFTVNLSYHLENPDLNQQLTEIALPPDTAFQKVIIESIEPEPISIYRDTDGNWLARYKLGSKEKRDISAKMFITVTVEPRVHFGQTEINPEDYLKPQPFWEAADSGVAALSKQLTTPAQIYDYVVKTLTYDYDRVDQKPERLGAKNSLENTQKALCLEFTDLFIAIARAAGIPARQVVGFAYTTNAKLRPLSFVADVLHSWPEYYDAERKLWVPVDPTWANTTGGINYFDKLDFNHLVFAVHGLNSDYPYPAGSYRKSGKLSKDVQVNFADPTLAPDTGKLVTRLKFPGTVLSGFDLSGDLVVENLSGTSFEDVTIDLSVPQYGYELSRHEDQITPFSRLIIPVRVKDLGGLFAFQKGTIVAVINGETIQKEFTVLPVYIWLGAPAGLAALVMGLLYLFFRNKHAKP